MKDDTDFKIRAAFRPCLALCCGLPEYPPAEGDDEPALLQQGDKLAGGHGAVLRARPAGQRFRAHHMPRIHGYLRLIDKLKPFELPLDALAQQFHQLQRTHFLFEDGAAEKDDPVSAELFGVLQRMAAYSVNSV